MNKLLQITIMCLAFVFGAQQLQAQQSNVMSNITGNFEVSSQYYKPDSAILAPDVPEKLLSNGFFNLNYESGNFKAGLRYESYLNALQGFDPNYRGSGITYRFAQFTKDEITITVGNFYDQFGNGLIFRSYEVHSFPTRRSSDHRKSVV